MRKAILKTVEELIVENENLIFIGSDLGVGVLGNAVWLITRCISSAVYDWA